MLQGNTLLKKLHLSANGIGDEGLKVLSNVLRVNVSLSTFVGV